MEDKKVILTEKFFKDLFDKISVQTVGKLCSIVETILEQDNEKAELLKKLLKNATYQQFREISYRIEAFQHGLDAIKITHDKPTSKD